MRESFLKRRKISRIACAVAAAGALCFTYGAAAASPRGAWASLAIPSEAKPPTGPTTKLKLRVLTNDGKPVGNASVYVRFYQDAGFLRHHENLAELDLKTNEDGSVKLPPVPRGKILIQVIATGWHTFGKWYDVEKPQRSITIKLKPPPHWY